MKKTLIFLSLVIFFGSACDKPVTALPPSTEIPANNSLITIKGEVTCLPHKGSGPATQECAIGFKDGKGNYYGLRNQPGGWRGNEVTGVFTSDTSGQYDVIGIIEWRNP